MENKEESLMRAILRVKRLGLSNCRFFQGNMDYFTGKFDIGVSLHACGVATDLVIWSSFILLVMWVKFSFHLLCTNILDFLFNQQSVHFYIFLITSLGYPALPGMIQNRY